MQSDESKYEDRLSLAEAVVYARLLTNLYHFEVRLQRALLSWERRLARLRMQSASRSAALAANYWKVSFWINDTTSANSPT